MMVHLSLQVCIRPYSKKFVDKLRIYVRGGSGGNGLPTLGGIGGKGGNVYIVGSRDKQFDLKSLQSLYPSKRFIADSGQNSTRASISGNKGASIFVPSPLGVSVIDATTKAKIGEISTSTDKILVARGGRGAGKFTNFIPKKGQARTINLDLKLIADVGFVGFPNAGKSTLLTKLSRAAPQIAEYPFTTIKPELGVAEYPDFRKITLADLPGLIEGAHMNKGRGHVFLKHIERTRLLLFVVDVTGFQLSPMNPRRNAFETIQLLMKELELYHEGLTKKPSLLAVNKMDRDGSQGLFEELMVKLENWEDHIGSLDETMIPKSQMKFSEIIPISALTNSGTDDLKLQIREEIDDMEFKNDKTLKLRHEVEEFKRLEQTSSDHKNLII